MRSMKKTEGSLAHSDVPSPHLVLGPEKVSVNSSYKSALPLRVDLTLASQCWASWPSFL